MDKDRNQLVSHPVSVAARFIAFSTLTAFIVLSPATAQPSISKRGPDPVVVSHPTYEEVFVTSNPQKGNETRTIKEAYTKIKNGGVIFITEMNSDISSDGTALIITRPVTIALDPDLKIQMEINGLQDSQDRAKARINAAADGMCFIMKQDVRGEWRTRRGPRNEVTIKDIEFAPNPANATTCIEVYDGKLFLDNVAITEGNIPFRIGVHIDGGAEVITNERFRVVAEQKGFEIRGGALTIADGATITRSRGAPAGTPNPDETCASAYTSYSMGIFASQSYDARLLDPSVSVASANISNFEYGICASGDGVKLNASRIVSYGIGIRADGAISVANTLIFGSQVAGIITRSPKAVLIDNRIYDNKTGLSFRSNFAPRASGNIIAFNGLGIETNSNNDPRSFAPDFSRNIVSCNIYRGNVADTRQFSRANARKNNRLKYCVGKATASVCESHRNTLRISAPRCAAGWRPAYP